MKDVKSALEVLGFAPEDPMKEVNDEWARMLMETEVLK